MKEEKKVIEEYVGPFLRCDQKTDKGSLFHVVIVVPI